MHLLVTSCAAAVLASGAIPQTAPLAVVAGTVKAEHSEEPIGYATVEVLPLGHGAVTDENGAYVISDVPTGRWRVRAAAPGYAPNELTVELGAGAEVRLDFLLELRPIRLRSLTAWADRFGADATAAARELYDREVQPGVVGVSGRELREVPAVAEPDVFRSLQALPGVTQLNDLSARLHVRGGGPDQNLFLLDGARIFGPYHLFGMFSAFNPDATGRVDFFRGSLPARYGGVLSSIVRIEQTDPPPDGTRMAGGVGLLGARFTAAGSAPYADARWLLAGRRTHADLLAQQFLDLEFPYAFYDVQGRLEISPGAGHEVNLAFFGSSDRFRMFTHNAGHDLRSAWRNLAGAVRWDGPGPGAWSTTGAVWASAYNGELIVGDKGAADPVANRVRAAGFRLETARQGDDRGIRLGLDVEGGTLRISGGETRGSYVVGDLDGRYLLPALYAEAERWFGGLRVAPGFRAVYDWPARRMLLEPRLGLRMHLAQGIALTAAAGRTHQLLSTLRDDRMVLPGAPLWFAHPDGAPASTADGVAIALDGWLGRAWQLTAAAYARRLLDVPRWRPVGTRRVGSFVFDDGRVAGMEFMARRHAGRITGWVGYGLARVRMTEAETGTRYAAAWDRRHSMDVAVFVRPSRRLSLSARAVYGSGLPFWPFVGQIAAARFRPLESGRKTPHIWYAPLWAEEQMRYPAYFRLDVGIRYPFHAWGTRVEPYISVLNLTGRSNVLYYELRRADAGRPGPPLDYAEHEAVLRPVEAFPTTVVPSFGIDVVF